MLHNRQCYQEVWHDIPHISFSRPLFSSRTHTHTHVPSLCPWIVYTSLSFIPISGVAQVLMTPDDIMRWKSVKQVWEHNTHTHQAGWQVFQNAGITMWILFGWTRSPHNSGYASPGTLQVWDGCNTEKTVAQQILPNSAQQLPLTHWDYVCVYGGVVVWAVGGCWRADMPRLSHTRGEWQELAQGPADCKPLGHRGRRLYINPPHPFLSI